MFNEYDFQAKQQEITSKEKINYSFSENPLTSGSVFSWLLILILLGIPFLNFIFILYLILSPNIEQQYKNFAIAFSILYIGIPILFMIFIL